jgi:hypothetical protein
MLPRQFLEGDQRIVERDHVLHKLAGHVLTLTSLSATLR